MSSHITPLVIPESLADVLEEQSRAIKDLTAQVRSLRLAVEKFGINVPTPKPLPPAPRPTFARFMAWCHGAGMERFYVAGAERAPKDCMGVVDGDYIYFVGTAVAAALGMKEGTDTSEIVREWLTAGLLDAHPGWDRHLLNSAKWPKYAPWFGTRKMFRARLDAPSCAG